MNTTKLLRSMSALFALFSVALMSPAQSPDNQDFQKVVAQGLTRAYGVPVLFVSRIAKPGDASSGVEVAKTNNALFIDPTPCLSNQQRRIIFVFVTPYKESKISDAKCDGKSYPQFQVIQQ
jgi:hypothetical protein